MNSAPYFIREKNMKKKRCSKCGKLKLVKEFYKNRDKKDGYGGWCKKCMKEYSQSEKGKGAQRKYQQSEKGKEAYKRGVGKYQQTEKSKEYKREYQKEKRKNDSMFKLNQNVITAMSNSLKNKKECSCHYFEKLGYTFEGLIETLTSKFLPGMTMNNYGEWHIDHKKPISSFYFESVDDLEFKECWSLENLQPLWAKDNLEKSNKIL